MPLMQNCAWCGAAKSLHSIFVKESLSDDATGNIPPGEFSLSVKFYVIETSRQLSKYSLNKFD
jgi:hypothetical protein